MTDSKFELLSEKYKNQLIKLKPTFRRGLIDEIEWSEQLICIKGARGVGKTTLLLQYIKETFGYDSSCLYVTLDDLAFEVETIYDLADTFSKKGGKYLFLDEIHKYENWSQELKNIYDSIPDLHVVFTGSSILHIYQGSADLSRRAVQYVLEGLSFREFLEIETKLKFNKYTLDEIFSNHQNIVIEILEKVKPLAYFDEYIKQGYYPYYLQNKGTYSHKLLNTVNLVLEMDIPFIKNVEPKYIHKLRKLLYMLAISVPYQPNINKLSQAIEVSRNTIMVYLMHLQDAKMIQLLMPIGKSYDVLVKPEKVYLHHPNLSFAIAPTNVESGNLRETFVLNQLAYANKVEASPSGDFYINDTFTIEVGGSKKGFKQIADIPNSYVAADNIEFGTGNKIPLWLFGFMR
ncbi:MAG: hypothetical protein RLZZ175_2887 [Bacteroidota bacterium]|jgi:predicted AAA+ superfamily ATPase